LHVIQLFDQFLPGKVGVLQGVELAEQGFGTALVLPKPRLKGLLFKVGYFFLQVGGVKAASILCRLLLSYLQTVICSENA